MIDVLFLLFCVPLGSLFTLACQISSFSSFNLVRTSLFEFSLFKSLLLKPFKCSNEAAADAASLCCLSSRLRFPCFSNFSITLT